MNSQILFCKKFKLLYTTRTISPSLTYRANIRLVQYKDILVNDLVLTTKFTKTRHFVILYFKELNQYAYSDIFDALYKRFTKQEREDIVIKASMEDKHIVINITLPNKEYMIMDWGTFYPNNNIINN